MTERQVGRTVAVAIALAVVAFLLLAGLFPEADPTHFLPGFNAKYEMEFIVEAPAKAHEARNWALFGEFHRNPADNYQFWRIQSPVWVYPLALVFRLFGVSYTTLRAVSVVYALVGVLGFLVFGRKGLSGPVLAAGVWLMVSNLFVTQVARSGLVEVALNAAAVWMVYALYRGREHPGWLMASQAVFGLAFFTKSGIVYAFPLLVIANIWTFLQWWRSGAFPRLRWLPVVSAVALAAFTTWWVLQPEYLRVLEWNTGHLVTGLAHHEGTGPSWYQRFDLNRTFQTWYQLFPAVGVLGLPGVFWLATRVVQRRGADRWEVLLLAWTVSCWAALIISRLWTIRHNTILFLPNYMVVAWTISQLWTIASSAAVRGRGMQVWVVAAVGLSLLVHVSHHVRHYSHLSWQIHETAQTVTAELGDRPAVFMGRFTIPLLLGTRYDVFYVKPGFNMEPERVEALKPTHLLRRGRDLADPFLLAADLPRPSTLQVIDFWGRPLFLQVLGPLPPGRERVDPSTYINHPDLYLDEQAIDDDEGEGDEDR